MFTKQAAQAIAGMTDLSDDTRSKLLAFLGNCAAHLEHRGPVTISMDMPNAPVLNLENIAADSPAGAALTVQNNSSQLINGEVHGGLTIFAPGVSWFEHLAFNVPGDFNFFETDIKCEGGLLRVYRRTITIRIFDGQWVKIFGAWHWVRNAGCCECGSDVSEGSEENPSFEESEESSSESSESSSSHAPEDIPPFNQYEMCSPSEMFWGGMRWSIEGVADIEESTCEASDFNGEHTDLGSDSLVWWYVHNTPPLHETQMIGWTAGGGRYPSDDVGQHLCGYVVLLTAHMIGPYTIEFNAYLIPEADAIANELSMLDMIPFAVVSWKAEHNFYPCCETREVVLASNGTGSIPGVDFSASTFTIEVGLPECSSSSDEESSSDSEQPVEECFYCAEGTTPRTVIVRFSDVENNACEECNLFNDVDWELEQIGPCAWGRTVSICDGDGTYPVARIIANYHTINSQWRVAIGTATAESAPASMDNFWSFWFDVDESDDCLRVPSYQTFSASGGPYPCKNGTCTLTPVA